MIEDLVNYFDLEFPIGIGLLYLIMKLVIKNIIKSIVAVEIDVYDVLAVFTVDLTFLSGTASAAIGVPKILEMSSNIYYVLLVFVLIINILFYIKFSCIRNEQSNFINKLKLSLLFGFTAITSISFYLTVFRALKTSLQ